MTSRDALIALVPPLFWGTGFAAAKPAVAHFPPLMMMAMIYSGIAVLLGLTNREAIRTPWLSLLLIAAFVMPVQGVFLFAGLQRLDVTTAALVLQSQVPAAIVLGWLFAGETLDARKIAGTAIALCGVAAVIGLPEERPPFWPVVLVIAGALAWAMGQVLARKLGRDDGIVQLKALSFVAVPQLLLSTLLLESGHASVIADAGMKEWLAFAFVGAVGFYGAYAVWFSLLRRCRIDEVAPFVLLMPVFGVFTAWAVLGEPVGLAQLAGGAVILAGLWIGTAGGARTPRTA